VRVGREFHLFSYAYDDLLFPNIGRRGDTSLNVALDSRDVAEDQTRDDEDLEDLPTFNRAAAGALDADQREISARARENADELSTGGFDGDVPPGQHCSHGSHGSHGSW